MVEVDKEQEGNNGDSRLSVLGSGCRALADSGKFWLEERRRVYLVQDNTFSVHFYADEPSNAPGFRIFWHAL